MKKVYIETGKYLFDISKITLGIAVITPLVKGGDISIIAFIMSFVAFAIGAYLINKGD